MNRLPSKVKIIAISVLAGFLLSSVTAFAVTLPNQANSQSKPAKTRLQDAKLKNCQAKENGIKKRSTQLANLAKNMQEKFDATAKRVQDYYTNTVVPSGRTVAEYDNLITDIQTKKTVIQTAITNVQNNFSDFSCTSDDPKGTMTQFREDMQAVKQALKNYRTSIKNLIVAVRSPWFPKNQ